MTADPASNIPYRSITVPESAKGERIDMYLTQVLDGVSRNQMRMLVHEGGAQVDGRTVRPSFRLRPSQQIRFRMPEPPADGTLPEPMSLDILFEDDGMVVVNKPAGMVVHPARGHWSGTMTAGLAYHFQSLSDIGGPTRPGIVHRLDRDTSGVIVVAKTNAVHMNLAEQFAERTVTKQYLAIVSGVIDRDRDRIDQPIGRHPYQRDKMAIRAHHATSKEATTFYEVMERFKAFTFVRLFPKTGRTHQLRVHLDHLRHPILCDKLYGGRAQVNAADLKGDGQPDGVDAEPLLQRQALHAQRLELDHPQSGKRLVFEAPIPADIAAVLELLRQS
ncbi:MAG: RluA family pseudouridine synthase [Pirellulaceae bacterium]